MRAAIVAKGFLVHAAETVGACKVNVSAASNGKVLQIIPLQIKHISARAITLLKLLLKSTSIEQAYLTFT